MVNSRHFPHPTSLSSFSHSFLSPRITLLISLLLVYVPLSQAQGRWRFYIAIGSSTTLNYTDCPIAGCSSAITLQMDACAPTTGWGSCGSLSWERDYTKDHKYLCFKDEQLGVHSDCDNVDEGYCPLWNCPHYHSGSSRAGISIKPLPAPQWPCQSHNCNPTQIIIQDPWNDKWLKGRMASIRIDGTGRDPYGIIRIYRAWYIPPIPPPSLPKIKKALTPFSLCRPA
ncbi:PREDICTED: uncharacterized protein LOC102017776 [Chinchilla lanigera]|uniref:uncharacterized protein LOC102017776 n=1 Tax=Chinchilla lanigera TaxID=34839 RepID=UPI00038EBD66|nr:PREDICTED: uncharacterized protein LOC102017776 [Chinchilla lanigera]